MTAVNWLIKSFLCSVVIYRYSSKAHNSEEQKHRVSLCSIASLWACNMKMRMIKLLVFFRK